jgi:hypothetical protein
VTGFGQAHVTEREDRRARRDGGMDERGFLMPGQRHSELVWMLLESGVAISGLMWERLKAINSVEATALGQHLAECHYE